MLAPIKPADDAHHNIWLGGATAGDLKRSSLRRFAMIGSDPMNTRNGMVVWAGPETRATGSAGIPPVCSDPAMATVFALAARVAPWRLSVMITGETGVGKEVAAQTIHRLSPRAGKPGLAANCR